jgi:hypothetical protein
MHVICMNSTFLIGKYKEQILTVIGVDENHQLLLHAFAFVDGESTNTWFWFLECVKLAVVMG